MLLGESFRVASGVNSSRLLALRGCRARECGVAAVVRTAFVGVTGG